MQKPPEVPFPAVPWVAAAMLSALALRLVFFSGLTGYDEFAYARIAGDIADGAYSFRDVSGYYGFRYLIVFPAALFHKIFGQTAYTAAAWPLVCSLGNTALAYFLGREVFGVRAGVTAAFFQAFLPLSVIYGTMLYPEEILAFWTGLCVLLFLRGSARTGRWGGAGLFALAGLCAGLGWHTRLNSGIILIVCAAWVLRRGARPAHLVFAAGFLSALAPDWAAGWALAGDPFFSLRSQLAKLAGDYAVYPAGHLIYLRGLLGIDLYGLALFGLYFYFFAAAAAAAAWNRRLDRLWLPLVWFAAVFAYLEFGPSSLSPYQPVHKQLRFLSMVFFPVIITSAWFVSGFRPALARAAAVLLLATSAAASWKMSAYMAAEAAPHRRMAAWLAERSPSAVYASGAWANSLGYYLRGRQGGAYYRPAGAPEGFVRRSEKISPGQLVPGACLVTDLSTGKKLPEPLPGLKKDFMEIPGQAVVYCIK